MAEMISPYSWDDERGVVVRGVDGDTVQAIQLCGNVTHHFRKRCGEMLVTALNSEHNAAAQMAAGKRRAKR